MRHIGLAGLDGARYRAGDRFQGASPWLKMLNVPELPCCQRAEYEWEVAMLSFTNVRILPGASRIGALADRLVSGSAWRLEHYVTLYRALLHSQRLGRVFFVGITGTAGKTTAKDLAAGILGSIACCSRSTLTMNEAYGVAKTILDTKPNHKFCVLEVSGGERGAMDWPLRFMRPGIAALTLIEREHVKSTLGLDGIAAEKARLIRSLPPGGTAVLNIDDPRVRAIGEDCGRKIIWVGQDAAAHIRLKDVRSRWPAPLTLSIEFEGRSMEVFTQLHGKHLALPVLVALGIAVAAGMRLEDAVAALADIPPAQGRMQIVTEADGVVFVRDDWKAPYWSLQAPLDFIKDADAGRKIIVLGTLSDYSLSASKVYPKVAKMASQAADLVVFVGPHALRAVKGCSDGDAGRIKAFPEIRKAAEFLRGELRNGDLVLLKGSHKTDHLVRLQLDRRKAVKCWSTSCHLGRFCNHCPKLRESVHSPARESAPAALSGRAGAPTPADSIRSVNADWLVVGLGNPGSDFHRTRHNIGFLMLDWLAASRCAEWSQTPAGETALIMLDGRPLMLFKPREWMNDSGPLVKVVADRIGKRPDECIVVHDDFDVGLGDIRLKRNGGDAGHRGVRSVISAFGTGEIWRVRIGVRRHGESRAAMDLAHERLQPDEDGVLAAAYTKAEQLIRERILASPSSCG